MKISLTMTNSISPALLRLMDNYRGDGMRKIMGFLGKTLEGELRAYFAGRESSTPNKHGWPRRHFWSKEVRNNTALTEVTDTSATVTIASIPFAHKVEGGPVRPLRKRNLAIPNTAAAYKAGSPREGGLSLRFIPLQRGNLSGVLVEDKGKK